MRSSMWGLFGVLLVMACGAPTSGPYSIEVPADAGAPRCEANATRVCACPGDVSGAQSCADDGNRWLPCVCPTTDAGAVVTPPVDAGSGCAGTVCGDACVDLRGDDANCGACGARCASGTACIAGVCATRCDGGLASCGGACVDTQRDARHCGACGMSCRATETCTAGSCAAMSAAIRVEWTFPGVWARPTGERWLPTYLLHLYGAQPAPPGPMRFDAACATVRNTGATAQNVTLRVSIPGYAAERTAAVAVAPGATTSRCVNPAWDLPRLYALRSITPMGLEVGATAADGSSVSTAMRSVSALPGNSFVLDQSYRDGTTTTVRDTYRVMGGYASVFAMPNDPTVTTVRRAVEARSAYGGNFGVIAWDARNLQYRSAFERATQTIAVGGQYWWRMYLEPGESIGWSLGSVTGGSDADIDVYLFTESQYDDWANRGGTSATQTWRDQRTLGGGSFTATAPGWYRFVLFNTRDNFVARSISITRTATRGEVAWDALRAVFEELRARGVVYRNISPGFFEGYQNISLPRETVAMRAANCFDGTLLFASILENVGFEPVIHVLQGHAYVGVRSAPQASGMGRVWYMETTMVGSPGSSWFDALLCGDTSCVVQSRANEVDIPVLPLRALGLRAIPY